MSVYILKPGLLDTVQDRGRFGQAALGINPSGAMDWLGMAVANALVGNVPEAAVLEMHFPAAEIRLEADVLLALAGADFTARADGTVVPVNTPVFLPAGAVLKFCGAVSGARCYLAVLGGFALKPWLDSRSTNRAAGAGGWQGRALQAGDLLPLREKTLHPDIFYGKKLKSFPWRANVSEWYATGPAIRFCPGPEYDWLTKPAQGLLENADWQIKAQSDRMGYRLNGPELRQKKGRELVSSAVAPGTLQLLPDGQLIILLADSQTTGGYPRIGHVIQADLPRLTQLAAGRQFQLQQVSLETAFALLEEQEQALRLLQTGCMLRLREALK